MKLIIWINGTHGVGKTTIAMILNEKLDRKAFILDSDASFPFFVEERAKKEGLQNIGGMLPQTNMAFMEEFKKDIIEYSKRKKIIIISMSACTSESKSILIDYFRNENFIHIVLEAKDDVIIERIMNDFNRDKELAIKEMSGNKEFIKNNYLEEEIIDTSELSQEEVANKIIEDYNLKYFIKKI